MEIQRFYVTFKQAKWLSELDKINVYYYWIVSKDKTEARRIKGASLMHFKYSERYPAPEQWQVVEWLRVNHGIFVFPDPVYDFSEWTGTIVRKGSTDMLFRKVGFNSPQEAYSAAFDYIINNNLIKSL